MKVSVNGCARCGAYHEKLEFKRFSHSVVLDDSDGTPWQYWATCPTNGDPILMRIVHEQNLMKIGHEQKEACGQEVEN